MHRINCSQCLRPAATCYCHRLRQIDNLWPVTIMQHANERKHVLATARIAALSLAHCQLVEGPAGDTQTQLEQDLQAKQPLLVYPAANAVDIAVLAGSEPRPLLLLDGTWRKTRRMLHESALLRSLPKVCLPRSERYTSRYRLRKSPRAGYLSSVETIAYMLGALEQNPAKYQPLLDTQEWLLQQQIKAMGETTYRRNYRAQP
ncbi:MAG: DTW domain-containing protein [Pseudomonadales bacterium]|nr:DTW domain-containing protein [Pseudomonadales bacterium]